MVQASSLQLEIGRLLECQTAMVLTLAAVFVGPVVFAKIAKNTIDPVAGVTDNGRHIIATGPIECTEGEKLSLRVTVTQRLTGAVARAAPSSPARAYTPSNGKSIHRPKGRRPLRKGPPPRLL